MDYTYIYTIYNTYIIYKRGFYRSIVVYLKDLSLYLDSSFSYSNS